MDRPCQLQINQSGAWRSALNFDASLRVVMCKTGDSGGHVATREVLMTWTRKQGWATT